MNVEAVFEGAAALLDALYNQGVAPFMNLVGSGLELILLQPLRLLDLPPIVQVVVVAVAAAGCSVFLRRRLRVEEKERAFRERFSEKRRRQEDLALISDWKSREEFAKVIDAELDQDFNTYLAGRFARYGLVYLLPIFLTLGWLDSRLGQPVLIPFAENARGYVGLTTQIVFLTFYCLALLVYFKLIRKRPADSGPSSPER